MLVVAMLLLEEEEEEENQSKRKRKQCWVRSWMLERKTKGSFHQLLPELAAQDTLAFERPETLAKETRDTRPGSRRNF